MTLWAILHSGGSDSWADKNNWWQFIQCRWTVPPEVHRLNCSPFNLHNDHDSVKKQDKRVTSRESVRLVYWQWISKWRTSPHSLQAPRTEWFWTWEGKCFVPPWRAWTDYLRPNLENSPKVVCSATPVNCSSTETRRWCMEFWTSTARGSFTCPTTSAAR